MALLVQVLTPTWSFQHAGLGLRSKHENSSPDHNQTSVVWQLTRAREANLAAYNDVLQRQHPPRVAGGDGPMYELVLARWNEAMDWMKDVPIFWNITVTFMLADMTNSLITSGI